MVGFVYSKVSVKNCVFTSCTPVQAGGFVAGPLVGLGDGGGGQAHGGDGGAIAGAGGQVAGDGEGFRRQGVETHLAIPIGEEPPLGAVDAAGVFGEDGLQGGGNAPVGGAQGRRCGRRAGDDLRGAGGGGHEGLQLGDFGGPKVRDKPNYRAAKQ